jgi:hypothetical protein
MWCACVCNGRTRSGREYMTWVSCSALWSWSHQLNAKRWQSSSIGLFARMRCLVVTPCRSWIWSRWCCRILSGWYIIRFNQSSGRYGNGNGNGNDSRSRSWRWEVRATVTQVLELWFPVPRGPPTRQCMPLSLINQPVPQLQLQRPKANQQN